jgi:hypothetical protein
MVAGDTARLTVEVFDKYWNPIPRDIAMAALTTNYQNADNSIVDFTWTDGKDGEIYADVKITTSGDKEFN